jgi:anion-transporting  ArsA/GET3 family ATPase
MGPVRQQADSVMALLQSSKTVVHLVTVLEEMPVQETIDGATELRSTGLPVGAVLVNMVRDPLLPDDALEAAAAGKVDKAALRRGLKAASLDADAALVTALAGEAADHAGRVLLERRERARLAELGRPTYELPLIDDAADLSGLYELAGYLHDVGMV